MTTDKTRPPLIYQATINASPETVFDTFFKEPQRWLCRHGSHIDAQPNGKLRLCWPDAAIEGRFLIYEPPSHGRFTWRFEADTLPETVVVVRTAADERGTALELEHYGFGVGPEWDMLYVGAARAWAAYLKNLRAVLEAGLDLREPDE